MVKAPCYSCFVERMARHLGSIKYSAIINDLNDTAFRRCVSLLYKELNFEYIPEEDVRRIDLCEKLSGYSTGRRMSPRGNGSGSYDEYLTALEYYLDNYLPCEKGSKAEQYKNRAKTLIANMKKKGTVEDCETVFAVFLGLARTLNPDFMSNKVIIGMTVYVSKDDWTLLKQIKDFEFIFEANQPFTKKYKIGQSEKQVFYVHNVIMLCRLMQAQGEYGEEE